MEASFASSAWPSLLPTFFSFGLLPQSPSVYSVPNQASCIILQPYIRVVHFLIIFPNCPMDSLLSWSYSYWGQASLALPPWSLTPSSASPQSEPLAPWDTVDGRRPGTVTQGKSASMARLCRNIENKHLSPLLGSPMRWWIESSFVNSNTLYSSKDCAWGINHGLTHGRSCIAVS